MSSLPERAPDASDDAAGHFAKRLNHLFATVPRRDGTGLYTSRRAADELTASGSQVTPVYIRMLRRGQRDNPSSRLLFAIARMFEVPMEYFFDDKVAARVNTQIELLRTSRVKKALVSAGFSSAELKALVDEFDNDSDEIPT